MNQEQLKDQIKSISNEVRRLGEALGSMREDESLCFDKNYEAKSVRMARRAEWISLRLRELVYMSTNVRKWDYLPRAAETMGIRIVERAGVYEITLPGLMPKRKSRKGTAYLIEPLYATLEKFIREHRIAYHAHYTVCFVLIYDRAMPERRVRDYDNLELKEVLDAAAAYLMVSDSGLLCDAYQTTELGKADCTQVFIMDTERYPEWYARRKAIKESGNPVS